MPEFLQSVGGQLVSPVGWVALSQSLLAAFALGLAVSWVYEYTFEGLSYSRGYAHALTLISVTAAVFVMAIGRSIYAGLGLLGVLSIIRFRANLKAPRDLVFLMMAATLGVACGVQSLLVAFGGGTALVLVVLYLHGGSSGSRRRFDGVVRFRMASGEESDRKVRELLVRYCSRTALLSMGDSGPDKLSEHTYQVKFKGEDERSRLVEELRSQLNVQELRLMLQESHLEY